MQIYALKIINNLSKEELLAISNFNDDNYGKNNNVVRELLFMRNMRDVYKIKHPNIINMESFWI